MKAFFLIAGLASATSFALAQERGSTASGSEISTQDIANAKAVKTFTPEEFSRIAEAQVKCDRGLIASSYSPESGFSLNGSTYGFDDFAKEIVRLDHERPSRCVYVAASCSNVALVARLMQKLKATNVQQVQWKPDPKLFPDKNSKMPQCPK